jgi:hypothetical protein
MKLFSMQLSEVNQSIKENLYNFIDGKFDEKLEKDSIRIAIETSFLLNHMEIKDADLKNKFTNRHNPFDSKDIVFSYNNIYITQRISTEEYSSEESIFSAFRNDVSFISCLESFLTQYKRDRLINNILE